MNVRFLHTADWQLGFTRAFLEGEAQHRFAEDRVEAVRAIGRLADECGAAFVVCAGDVFEHNQVDARTVRRSLDALAGFTVPVWLLPGNHDPLDAAAVWRSPLFTGACPTHVRVLDTAEPVEAAAGVDLVGVPWPAKRPDTDLVGPVLEDLRPARGRHRILVAHGQVEGVAYRGDEPADIPLRLLTDALEDGRLTYAALGDRHSVGDAGHPRAWYPGTPEVTRFAEARPGHALEVTLADADVDVRIQPVGRWTFIEERRVLGGQEDVALLGLWLREHPSKARTVLRLRLEGQLPLRGLSALQGHLEVARETFAALDLPDGLPVAVPDAVDRDALELSGYARDAFDRLATAAVGTGPGAVAARDGLTLLHRLAGRGGVSPC